MAARLECEGKVGEASAMILLRKNGGGEESKFEKRGAKVNTCRCVNLTPKTQRAQFAIGWSLRIHRFFRRGLRVMEGVEKGGKELCEEVEKRKWRRREREELTLRMQLVEHEEVHE